ncbi:MAG: TolC family protein [Planctomycetota bacterium]|jgi:outer membrane protein TolC
MEHHTLRLSATAIACLCAAGCGTTSPFAVDVEPDVEPAVLEEPSPPPARTGDHRAEWWGGDEELPRLGDDATLADYQRYAALRSADVEAAFHDWQAARERLPQVRALPDPRFTYGYYINEVETRVGPMRHSFGLTQTLPWFGKLDDQEQVAARAADAAWQRMQSARLDLDYRVEEAYNELYFLERSIQVTRDTIDLLQQIERVALTRYQVAAGGHPDLIRLQIELGGVEDRLAQLEQLRTPYAARLNAELNRPAGAPLAPVAAVQDRTTDASAGTLLATLRERNPELLALQEEIERERIAMQIARSDGLPDLTVGVAYTEVGTRTDASPPDNGDDALLATLSVNVPIWREKYDAGVREALARRLAAAGRRNHAANRLESGLQQAIFDHRDARRRLDLYSDTLVPKATESLQAVLASFAQGLSDFLDLIDTQRTLLEFQLSYERAIVDRATSYARIERLIGTALDELAAPVTSETGS